MISAGDVEQAAQAVAGVARETPLLPAKRLARQVGGELWLKLENLQVTGSFKVRGAVNRLSVLSDGERSAGVLAASAGNHAQAVAWAARKLGTHATLFMPREAPLAKIAAVREYGGDVRLGGGSLGGGVVGGRGQGGGAGGAVVRACGGPGGRA